MDSCTRENCPGSFVAIFDGYHGGSTGVDCLVFEDPKGKEFPFDLSRGQYPRVSTDGAVMIIEPDESGAAECKPAKIKIVGDATYAVVDNWGENGEYMRTVYTLVSYTYCSMIVAAVESMPKME